MSLGSIFLNPLPDYSDSDDDEHHHHGNVIVSSNRPHHLLLRTVTPISASTSTSSNSAYGVLSQISVDLRATIADLLIPSDCVMLEEMVGKGIMSISYQSYTYMLYF